LKKGKIQLNLYGGYNILSEKLYKVGDSLLLKLPELEVVKHIKFEKGKSAFIIKGKNTGRIAKIEEFSDNMVVLSDGKEKISVPKHYIYVIGDSNAEVTL
jgi:small subunit ribosomal protein S4e